VAGLSPSDIKPDVDAQGEPVHDDWQACPNLDIRALLGPVDKGIDAATHELTSPEGATQLSTLEYATRLLPIRASTGAGPVELDDSIQAPGTTAISGSARMDCWS